MTAARQPLPRLHVRSLTCIPVEVPLRYVLGTSPIPVAPGTGIAWDPAAVERHRIA